MTVTPRAHAVVTLPLGRILIVTAGPNSRGSIWRLPEDLIARRSIVGWAEPDVMFTTGPFAETRTFKIVAMSGELEFETKEVVSAEITQHTEERNAMSEEIETALGKVDAAAAPSKRAPAPGSFAAGIRRMMDEARDGVAKARADGLAQVGEAVGKLNEAKVATTHVAGKMAAAIEDEAADVMAELGQISNDLGLDP